MNAPVVSRGLLGIAALTVTCLPAAFGAVVEVDAAIKPYETVSGVSGSISSMGSDTLNDCMTFWAEGFKKRYPNVKIQIEAKGSGSAPTALIAGTADFGPMSREIKKEEADKFEAKFGYKPLGIKVAVDALAVFVHKDNPLTSLTMEQVDGIFSSTRKRGGVDIADWGILLPAWQGKALSLYGRNSISGTYGFFKDHSLKNGDFKAIVKEQAGSSAVISGVAGDETGIGYSGIGYMTSGVKGLLIAEKGEPAAPTYENCLNGSYPLARFLYVYVNRAPGKALEPKVAEFIKFVASKEGQEAVIKAGFFPLPPKSVDETHAAIK